MLLNVKADVASRGPDIPPHVDIEASYDIPTYIKDYVLRVGRTSKAGRPGEAVSFVSQYDAAGLYQRIEQLLG